MEKKKLSKTKRQQIKFESSLINAISTWLYFFAFFSMLLFISYYALNTISKADDLEKVSYNVIITSSLSGIYGGEYSHNFTLDIFIGKSADGYVAKSFESNLKSINGLSSGDIEEILLSPGIEHFTLPKTLLKNIYMSGSGTYNNWSLKYLGRTAIQITPKSFLEGYEVTLSFTDGEKDVVYDTNTGILIYESFYLDFGNGTQYFFMVNYNSSGGGLIQPKKISDIGTLFFTIAPIAILILSIFVLLNNKKYRIL